MLRGNWNATDLVDPCNRYEKTRQSAFIVPIAEHLHRVYEVQVYFDDLDPNAVRVELYAEGAHGGGPVRQEMKRVRQLIGAPDGYVYSAAVSATRPPTDYTARVIPHCDGVAIPLEEARMLWQR